MRETTRDLPQISRRRFLQSGASAFVLLASGIAVPRTAFANDKNYLVDGYIDCFLDGEVSGRADILDKATGKPTSPEPVDVRVQFRDPDNFNKVAKEILTKADKPKHNFNGKSVSWAVPVPDGSFKVVALAQTPENTWEALPTWKSQWYPDDEIINYNFNDFPEIGYQSTDLGNGLKIEIGTLSRLMRRSEPFWGAAPDGFSSLVQKDGKFFFYSSGITEQGQTSYVSVLNSSELSYPNLGNGVYKRGEVVIPTIPPLKHTDNPCYQAGGSAILDASGRVHLFGHRESVIQNYINAGVSFGEGFIHTVSENGLDFSDPETILQPPYAVNHNRKAGQGTFHIRALPYSLNNLQNNEALVSFDNWPETHKDGGMVFGKMDLRDPKNTIKFWKDGSFSSNNMNDSIRINRAKYPGKNIWHPSPVWLSDGRLAIVCHDFSNEGAISMIISERSLSSGSSVEEIIGSFDNAPIKDILRTEGWNYRYASLMGMENSFVVNLNQPAQLVVGYNRSDEQAGLSTLPGRFSTIIHAA